MINKVAVISAGGRQGGIGRNQGEWEWEGRTRNVRAMGPEWMEIVE